ELTVALRPGKPRVRYAHSRSVPVERGFGHLAPPALVDGRGADAPALDMLTSRLELRLHEDDRLPAALREREDRRKHSADADERDVAGDELRREGQLREGARIHA